MSHIITAARPAGGEILAIDSVPNGKINLSFDPAEATAFRENNSLVFTFKHGGKIFLNEFFTVGDEKLPDLVLPDGKVVASTDFFAGSDLDLSTAAGPHHPRAAAWAITATTPELSYPAWTGSTCLNRSIGAEVPKRPTPPPNPAWLPRAQTAPCPPCLH